jgi:hypothetical protein
MLADPTVGMDERTRDAALDGGTPGPAMAAVADGRSPRRARANGVLAVVSAIGATTIGSTTTGWQAVAGVSVILDSAWIFVVSRRPWREPGLARP